MTEQQTKDFFRLHIVTNDGRNILTSGRNFLEVFDKGAEFEGSFLVTAYWFHREIPVWIAALDQLYADYESHYGQRVDVAIEYLRAQGVQCPEFTSYLLRQREVWRSSLEEQVMPTTRVTEIGYTWPDIFITGNVPADASDDLLGAHALNAWGCAYAGAAIPRSSARQDVTRSCPSGASLVSTMSAPSGITGRGYWRKDFRFHFFLDIDYL